MKTTIFDILRSYRSSSYSSHDLVEKEEQHLATDLRDVCHTCVHVLS